MSKKEETKPKTPEQASKTTELNDIDLKIMKDIKKLAHELYEQARIESKDQSGSFTVTFFGHALTISLKLTGQTESP